MNSDIVASPSALTPSRRRTMATVRRRTARSTLQRRVVHVPHVELQALWPPDCVPAMNLRPPGQTGTSLQAAPLPSVVPVDVCDGQRARTDHAHVSLEDRPQLRELVETRRPQLRSEPCQAISVRQQLARDRHARRSSNETSGHRSMRRAAPLWFGGRAPANPVALARPTRRALPRERARPTPHPRPTRR